jgi:hypothetical protein
MKRLSSTMRRIMMVIACLSSAGFVLAQPDQSIETVLKSLTAGSVPADLLSTKTIALYDPAFSAKELEQIQTGFERTGVDAVLYFPFDLPMSGRDIQKAFSDYLIKREIKYIVFLQKKEAEVQFTFVEFSKTKELIKPGQPGWKISGRSINEASMDIYRTALNSQKRVNMLISPTPDYDLQLRFIRGTRGEYFAIDLKIDRLAIIRFGNEEADKAMEGIFKTHYPFNYQFFDAGTDERDIRQKNFLYVLCFVHTRGSAAMELLDYDKAKSGSAIASVSYPNGQMQLKTIDANESVYKFYFKHLENGNLYLGTKWDADTSWEQALLNQIKGLKAELRIN